MVAWMKDLVAKFFKPGELVMDPSAGLLATSKELLQIRKHKRFIGGVIDSRCLDADLTNFLLVFEKQVLDEESDITVD